MKDRHLLEPTVSTETVFEGKIVSLQIDTVTLPNGKRATREIIRHPGAVAVLAITNEGRVLLVRQFRKPCNRILIEIPAGKLEPGEDPAECAKRELLEETGYRAAEWRHLHSMYTSPGFADELIHLYAATGLEKGVQQLDADEFLDLMEADRSEVKRFLASGDAADAKTIAALYWWLNETAEFDGK
jgi:ADP-ribose pyrophosphatase